MARTRIVPRHEVARRSPASERAAVYSYGDLLKDSLSLLREKAKANVARMTSGGLSDEEVLEIGLAPAGGMLKVAGTSRLLAGLLRRRASHFAEARKAGFREDYVKEFLVPGYRKTGRVFREALKIPEKEYRRIKEISWGIPSGQSSIARGIYDPSLKKISLHPKLEDLGTVWHEFTHARQWTPEKGEEITSRTLRLLNEELSRRSGLSGQSHFYYNISPIEKHARNVAMTMTTGSRPSEFSKVYKGILESALAEGEKQVGLKQARELWDIALEMERLK